MATKEGNLIPSKKNWWIPEDRLIVSINRIYINNRVITQEGKLDLVIEELLHLRKLKNLILEEGSPREEFKNPNGGSKQKLRPKANGILKSKMQVRKIYAYI